MSNILHERLLDNLHKNVHILSHILKNITQTRAATWRDGSDGWTVLEVVCHLRDYDPIFLERGQLMLAQDQPTYPVYDHLAMVINHAYNEQDLGQVYNTLASSREQVIAFFTELNDQQWQRVGQHVNHGRYTVEALAAHIVWHDANHIEQITRIMAENM